MSFTAVNTSSSFIGRDSDLGALGARLADARLVSLLGPPGIGKTRLAIEYARRHGDSHSGGVSFCDLTAAADASQLAMAVVRALDVTVTPERSGIDPLEAVGRALRERGDALIILDNFDHLVRDAEATLVVWMLAAPAVRFLITSRVRLGIDGEAVFDLLPLSVPDGRDDVAGSEAIQLFVARARAVRRDFTLSSDNEADVTALVRELDGLPLAIELCAARVRVLSPAQLLSRMSRRFDLLRDDAQGGLWDAIQSSWELLSASEAEALAACSVFSGTFDVDAAEAVIASVDDEEGPWAVDLLHALVDSSLVATSDANLAARSDDRSVCDDRFGLYVSIRDHAAAMLDRSGRTAAVKRRHAEHYARVGVEWGEAVRRRGSVEAIEALSADRDNLLAAYGWAIGERAPILAMELALGLAPVLLARGPLTMGMELLQRAADSFGDAPMPAALRARYLEALAPIMSFVSDEASRRAVCEEGLGLAAFLGDRLLEASMQFQLGLVSMQQRDLAAARRQLESSLTLYRARGDRRGEGLAHSGLGNIAYIGEMFDEAARCYERALECQRASGDRVLEGNAMYLLGTAELDEGNLDRARHHLETALALLDDCGDRRWLSYSAGYLAIIDQEQGRFEEARAGYERAVAESERMGAHVTQGFLGAYLGNCLLEQGRVGEAIAAYDRSLHAIGNRPHSWTPLLLGCGGAARAMAGDVERGREMIALAEARSETKRNRFLVIALGYLAAVVDLAAADQSPDPIEAAALRSGAVARFRTPLEQEPAQSDVRFARRMLRRALDRAGLLDDAIEPEVSAGDPRERFVVERTGRWFRVPGGKMVKLYRRRSMQRILCVLASSRMSSPGVALPLARLVEAGWPGERIQPDAAAGRVYAAIATLRRLGLRSLLTSIHDGYALDPMVELALVDEPDSASP